ncbi:ankyrin repeat domain-containing protein [Nannocystis radixulma]|uniref:Ankyrin repeat domain-containing protein n=1 Tax=Nannocystis radixulma TaxID=2995305 RepID=A0ABT5BNI2_9BACT|nr:ankyrin repeat domain-containing protein [Nannocystis radixulma]MDC0675731.1 ankyrin repeat domain-containing protein [Nannocystis radixulma]
MAKKPTKADATKSLLSAIETKKLAAAKDALEAGADPNALGDRTPVLWIALYAGKYDIAKLLVDHGAKVDWADDYGTLLAGLVDNEGEKIPKPDAAAALWLIEHGANCTRASRPSGRTPLMDAVRSGHHELIDALIANGATVGPDKPTGNTPLHWAVASRADQWVWDRLLAAGNKLEAKNRAGETPLSLAQAEWNHAAVAFLLAKGAKRDVKVAGKTPLERAVATKQAKIIKLLR